MARDISVSIAVQGEKEFNQALKSAQSAVKVLSSELKASEASQEIIMSYIMQDSKGGIGA